MKVKDLIKELKKCNPDAETNALVNSYTASYVSLYIYEIEAEKCNKTELFCFGEGLCGGYEQAFCNLEKGHKGKHKMIINKGSGLEQVKYEWK